MPKTGRFAGLVDSRKTPATSEPTDETPQAAAKETTRQPDTMMQAKTPTKLAKYKDPNLKGFSFLLDIEMHAKASFLLKKQRTSGNMSDLVARLMSGWIAENEG